MNRHMFNFLSGDPTSALCDSPTGSLDLTRGCEANVNCPKCLAMMAELKAGE